MAVALSPYPDSARDDARTCLRAGITTTGVSDARLDATALAASALVERYAPAAPDAVRSEAMVRLVGWLLARRPRAETAAAIGTIQMTYARERQAPSDPLGFSGAAALLAPWRRRRALPVEEST